MVDNQSLVPVIHSKFRCESDKEYIDVEDININLLAETTNLTPNRKEGSLSLIGGQSFAQINGVNLDYTHLPQPGSGYTLIDMYSFSLDRDNKEITILCFQHSGGEVKYYINPYFNPESTYSNYNPNKSQNSWIYEWIELTEYYDSNKVDTKPNSYDITTLNSWSNVDYYFNGWFIVNTTLTDIDYTKYNFVTNYIASTKTITLKVKNTTWTPTDNIRIYRFPVQYFYNASVVDYSDEGTTFKGAPTDFNYSEGQLRIACGKEHRPLILTDIYKQKYFTGKDSSGNSSQLTYDGLWWDFAQIPQVQKKAAVSAFGKAQTITTGITSLYILPDGKWNFIGTPTNGILATPNVSIVQRLTITDSIISGNPFSDQTKFDNLINNYLYLNKLTNDICFYNNLSTQPSIQTVIDALNASTLGGLFTFTLGGSAPNGAALMNISGTAYSQDVHFATGSDSTFFGEDVGGNKVSYNKFVGSIFTVNPISTATVTAMVNIFRTAFICSVLIDKRNEVMICNGLMRPNNTGTVTTGGTASYGSKLAFNTWFSRRITDIKLYSKLLNGNITWTPLETMIADITDYPYYLWNKKYRPNNSSLEDFSINEVPLLSQYSINEFSKGVRGEIIQGIKNFKNESLGVNAYTLHLDSGYFYVQFKDEYNSVATSGKGLQFISDTNRYLYDDITMNYTRICKFGQTNGRFFIIGCKNSVEEKQFESDDVVMYNVLSAGVSSYDIFSRDTIVNVGIGDKDINRAISVYDGFLLVIKDTNVYAIDISTDDEVRFRVVKTQIGRGAIVPDSICYTAHGVVLPAKDGVYLISPNNSRPLLRPDNGRLNFYKTYFANKQINTIYYNDFDEIFLVQTDATYGNNNYIMIYNFQKDTWTTLTYSSVIVNAAFKAIKARNNASRQIMFINYKDATHYNITKFDETSSTYINAEGTTETPVFTIKTHYLAYGQKLRDVLLSVFQLRYDSTNASSKVLRFTILRNGQANETKYFTIPTTAAENKVFTQLLASLGASDQVSLQITNLDNNGIPQSFSKLNINSFLLWLTSQNRQLIQTT